MLRRRNSARSPHVLPQRSFPMRAIYLLAGAAALAIAAPSTAEKGGKGGGQGQGGKPAAHAQGHGGGHGNKGGGKVRLARADHHGAEDRGRGRGRGGERAVERREVRSQAVRQDRV